jgi:anhydro-N-acetylmuramic acid kinase
VASQRTFSNISFEENDKRMAFDISPVNTVLNFYANQLGHDYDDKGTIAKFGKLDYINLSSISHRSHFLLFVLS